MTSFWIVSTCILCFLLTPSTKPDPVFAQDTFSQFCKYPGQFGQGEMQGTTKCIVKYPKGTNSKQEASDFCRKLSPYTTTASKEGKPTTCTYEKEYVCKEHEEDIFDHCFVIKQPTGEPFSPDACPEGYTLHVLQSKEEFQWIAVVFEKYSKLWVGNIGNSANFLKPTERPKVKKRDAADTKNDDLPPIFIAVRDGFGDKTKRGSAYYGEKHLQFPYLCSRPAHAFEETIEDDNNHMKDIGFDIYSIKDKDGTTRSFISFTKMFAVDASRYEADFKDLHKACKAVKGHIAAREDFETEAEYRKVLDEALKWRVAAREDFGSEEAYRNALNKFGPWMVRTTVGRSSSFHLDPISSCGKDKLAETNRKHWSYFDGNGSALTMRTDVWSSGYPDSTCADLPRITAGMYRTGYIDLPAIARRPLICVAGVPSIHREKYKKEEACNRAAVWNPALKRCECRNPQADGRIMKPELYSEYPPGTVCMDCQSTVEMKTVLFLLDRSGSVELKGWLTQLDFMKSIANSVKPVLAAVIVMKQIPFVALDFGHHSAAAIDAFIARNRQYAQDSNTYNGYSLHLARQLMQKQTSKHKVIIFIGDGGYDNTEYADIYPDLEMANAARREGIRILYLAIGEYVDPYSPNYARTWHQHALRLAGGEENYIQIADFDDLVGDKMFEVVKQLCRIVY